jgi:lysozyme
LKKSSSGLNTLFLLASGGLILYVISRLFQKKKKAIPELGIGYKPAPVLPSLTSNSYDEIYQLIKKEEGINYTAKRDGSDEKGNPLYTIGIGHQIQPGEEYLLTATITEEQAIEIFAKDIEKIVADMNKNIKVQLNKNQQLALISLRYRIGPNYFNGSTLLKELNKGNYQKASEEFKNWRISEGRVVPGLVARAERERVRFLTPVSQTGIYTPPLIPPIERKTGSPFVGPPQSAPKAIAKQPPFTINPGQFPFIFPRF